MGTPNKDSTIMRKSLIVLAAIVPLIGLGGFAAAALPALAETEDDDAVCIATPARLPAGPIDLEAIPAQHVSGPLTVRGAGLGCGDEDDDHGNGDRGHEADDD
jgi:hypothetical protein